MARLGSCTVNNCHCVILGVELLWEDCLSSCLTGRAIGRNLQQWDLCERDYVSVRMANKSHCVVARLKVLARDTKPCSCGIEVTFAAAQLLVQILLFLLLQGESA